MGMAFPWDSTYLDKFSLLYGNLDIAGVQSPQPHIIDKVQESIKWLHSCISVQYGQEYLLEKSFPHLFQYGEGGWYYKCLLGLSQFRLLDPKGCFVKDSNFPFLCLTIELINKAWHYTHRIKVSHFEWITM